MSRPIAAFIYRDRKRDAPQSFVTFFRQRFLCLAFSDNNGRDYPLAFRIGGEASPVAEPLMLFSVAYTILNEHSWNLGTLTCLSRRPAFTPTKVPPTYNR